MLRLFVYGTLKRGMPNSGLIPEGAVRSPARTRGVLYDAGWFPILAVPPPFRLRLGSADYEADAALSGARPEEPRQLGPPGPESGVDAFGVAGELVSAPGARLLLPVLDLLEGFKPDDPGGSLYVRALVIVEIDDGRRQSAWAYAVDPEAPVLAGLPVVPGGNWNP